MVTATSLTATLFVSGSIDSGCCGNLERSSVWASGGCVAVDLVVCRCVYWLFVQLKLNVFFSVLPVASLIWLWNRARRNASRPTSDVPEWPVCGALLLGMRPWPGENCNFLRSTKQQDEREASNGRGPSARKSWRIAINLESRSWATSYGQCCDPLWNRWSAGWTSFTSWLVRTMATQRVACCSRRTSWLCAC